ncbi:HNH endonuclease signature motif containing protein [Streptomyces sp. NPDC046685]|uniref:HNH endonuclease n=1 Tax=Streptomyces sp. NPDC046685 TaxID=3157202 RepID=UPI0033F31670
MARRRTGPTDLVRSIVYQRDDGRCVRCAADQDLTIHHRVNRGMGGAREAWINQAHNLLLVCRVCNSWFEDNPKVSYEAGWKVRRPELPNEVEVRYSDGLVYRLDPDGTRRTARVVAR